MTEEESQKIQVAKRKDQEEDGTEDGRGRKRRTGKGKERERMEGTEGVEDEWRGQVEERLERLEGMVRPGRNRRWRWPEKEMQGTEEIWRWRSRM